MTANKTAKAAMFDVVISGGGVVGCLAAFALAKHCDLKVCLLEASAAQTNDAKHAGFDAKVIALAANTLNVLASLGVDLNEIVHEPIKHIHVSDRGHIGQVRLNAKDLGLEALGKVVAIDALGQYLLNSLEKFDNVTILRPAKVINITQEQSYNLLSISDGQTVKCNLLLISDGGKSITAELVNIKREVTDYQQVAIISNIQTQLPHNNTAFERFTQAGPLALLPMQASGDEANERLMSIVWCVNKESADELMAISDNDFLRQLQLAFSFKLGNMLRCTNRYTYPLSLVRVEDFCRHRVICIGNAAQTLHPIAGQGFNLGLRDVASLLDVFAEQKNKDVLSSFDCGSFAVTQAYLQARNADKNATILATDGLLRIFSNAYSPMVTARNIGLLAMNKLPKLKQIFADFAMGNRD